AYYDGQGFMVRKDLGVDSALKLSGATICAEQGTTTEQNVADYFTAHQMKYEAVVIDSADSIIKAFDSGRCDVYTTDASALYAQRLKLTDPAAFTVLPD
ncbi:transporter substrate-binding domain-containing protein, partial [Mesorhizobium sp. M1C.F.Ca.ET.212.01.1.1]